MITKEDKEKILELFEDEHIEIVEAYPWNSSSKYQTQKTIVRYDNRFFAINQSRTGSFHSDYEYYPETVYEVVPVEVTKFEWKKKND